jgi:hypothetical protein
MRVKVEVGAHCLRCLQAKRARRRMLGHAAPDTDTESTPCSLKDTCSPRWLAGRVAQGKPLSDRVLVGGYAAAWACGTGLATLFLKDGYGPYKVGTFTTSRLTCAVEFLLLPRVESGQ